MKEFTYVIADKLGIHARPAGMLAKEEKSMKVKFALRRKKKKYRRLSLSC